MMHTPAGKKLLQTVTNFDHVQMQVAGRNYPRRPRQSDDVGVVVATTELCHDVDQSNGDVNRLEAKPMAPHVPAGPEPMASRSDLYSLPSTFIPLILLHT